MSEYKYDDIYGISLAEYTARHGLTIDDFIEKVRMDIAILKENQIRVHSLKLPYPDNYLENVVYTAIKKKETHLGHLLEWANNEKYQD